MFTLRNNRLLLFSVDWNYLEKFSYKSLLRKVRMLQNASSQLLSSSSLSAELLKLPIATFSAKLRDMQVYFANEDLFAVFPSGPCDIQRRQRGFQVPGWTISLEVKEERNKKTHLSSEYAKRRELLCSQEETSHQPQGALLTELLTKLYLRNLPLHFISGRPSGHPWEPKKERKRLGLEMRTRCITRDGNSNREEIFPKQLLFFPWKSTLPQITSAQNTSLTHAEGE